MTPMWKAALAAILVAAIAAVAAIFGFVCKPKDDVTTNTAVSFRVAMRKAWSEHAWYTREYYIAAILGAPNGDATTARLLKNQEDIGAVFGQFYGPDAGTQTTALLKDHILIAVDIVAAAKAGDQAAFAEADARWHKNFDDLAKVLAQLNPAHFAYEPTLKMLNDHLDLLNIAVVSFLGGNYVQSVADNDAYYAEALAMADHFSHGIVAQFPAKFP